jgi:Tol biopolymer transport system component
MSHWTRIRPRTGRHLNVRSPLSRLEWGTAGRHRRRVRRGLVAGAVVALLAAGAVVWFFFFRENGGSPTPTQASQPACASARLPGHLGAVAWIDGAKLVVRNLDTCATATLVSRDAAGPVRFSPDGRWIAYGSGTVVSTSSGKEAHALGNVASWSWTPDGHTLIGVAKDGRVLAGEPGATPSLVLVHGAAGAAIDPGGRRVAVAVKNRIEVTGVDGGPRKVIFSGPSKTSTKIAGWSPDGKWIVFWNLDPGATSGPLDVAPVSGAGYHNIFTPAPGYDDFVTWCGDTLVASGGGADLVTEGQQLLVSRAPVWQTHDLTRDFRSSWIWPSCSPNGKWIAVTVTPNHTEFPPGQGERRVELISIDGKKRVKLALGAGVFEVPRWSADGRTLLVIQRHRDPKAGGTVELVLINPKTGKVVKTVNDVAQLPAVKTPNGHTGWTSKTDWFRD